MVSESSSQALVEEIRRPICSGMNEKWLKKKKNAQNTALRTNKSILQQLDINPEDRILSIIQRRIIKNFDHAVRKDGIEKMVIQGKVEGRRITKYKYHRPNQNFNKHANGWSDESRCRQRGALKMKRQKSSQ